MEINIFAVLDKENQWQMIGKSSCVLPKRAKRELKTNKE